MKHLLLLLTLAFTINVNAQDTEKVVTLVASGQGKTLEGAKIIGLRNAIEQVYGTFVSSSSSIVNDSLVKDEIATVSSGNIEKYDIISSEKTSNDEYYITLNVTVSISRLTSYVESKGGSVELKGSVFADNIKIKKLNKK